MSAASRNRKYRNSEKGKATQAAWSASDKGKAIHAAAVVAYNATDKFKAVQATYIATDKGRAARYLYRFRICNPTQEQFEHYEATTKCECCAVEFGPNGRLANGKCQDHDHKTNKLRGVICSSCNRTEGHAGTTERAYQVACYIASNMTLKELIEGLP